MTKRSTARDPAVARTDLLDSPLTVENQFDDVSDMLSPEQLLWAILYCASGENGAYRDHVPRWAWSLNKRCCPNLDCLRTAFRLVKCARRTLRMSDRTIDMETPQTRGASSLNRVAVRSMRWLCRIVCKWKGHDEVNDLQAWECLRCGRVMDYDEAVKAPWRERLRYWLRSKKEWWRCPECGQRFGKHNDEPHIPF